MRGRPNGRVFKWPTQKGELVEVLRPQVPHTRREQPATELFMAETGGSRTFWCFAKDRALRYPHPNFKADLEKTSGGYVLNVELNVEARTYIRDLCLLADKLKPHVAVDTQLLTLLPGGTGAFHVRTAQPLAPEACLGLAVLYSANRFGSGECSDERTRQPGRTGLG